MYLLVILIQLLMIRECMLWDQFVNVGVIGVVRNVFIFQIRLGWVGDNFVRLCLNIVEVDFFVFFIQCQMCMVMIGKFVQGSLGFYGYLIVGFWCQCQDYFCCINCGVQYWLVFCWIFCFGVVEFMQQIYFVLGVLGNFFIVIIDFFYQWVDRGKVFVSCWIIVFYDYNVWCGFIWDQVVFVFFLVFYIQRLCQFSGRVMLDRQCDDVGFFIQMVDVYFGEFFCDGFVDFLVVFCFLGWIDCCRQWVNKWMYI